ncbi:MAG: RHS repeat-associated core domain-containing protein [Niastella sp.]|nr:RHS repeat-associated core domain-containing protein [Niastella sp.]
MKTGCRYFVRMFVVVFLLAITAPLRAANDPSRVLVFEGKLGEMIPNAFRENIDLVYENPATRVRIDLTKPQFYTNVVTLLVDEKTTKYITTDFKCKVVYNLEYTKLDGVVVTENNLELTVDYKKAEGAKYDARQYKHFTQARKVKVTIVSIDNFGSTWDVTEVLRMENRMDITRDYFFNTSEQVAGLADNGSAATVDELKVSWDENAVSGLTHYDIEWAWADANVINRYKTGGVFDANLIFTDNSSRVTVENKFVNEPPHYNVPMLYDGLGYLFYRVRPVQYLVSGRLVNGQWSAAGTTGVTYFVHNGHQTNLNWQASTSFAEEGKRKTVIQYFDGTLRSRQTVTKDNVTQTTVVAETFYDYQGRPSIQVLPAPTLSTVIQYAQNFNRFTGETGVYRKDMYDLVQPNASVCNTLSATLDNGFGASNYYSPNNPQKDIAENKFIPDAQGYPYTETRYVQDATGRIAAQSGVGPTHKFGAATDPDHATRYFYGTANPKELVALFGTEVGDASHYFKNMVRDANGQYSVSYQDMTGKTIATALAGVPPSNVEALPSYTDMVNSGRIVTESLLTPQNNIIQGRNIAAVKTLVVPKAATYTFNYSLNPQSAEILACTPAGQNVCYDCLYDLEIRITNSCGTFERILNRTNFTLGTTPDITCTPAPSITVINEQILLEEGEYTVSKVLSLSAAGQQWYKDNLFKIKNVCKTFQEFYDSTYQVMLQESNCNPTCATCTTAVGTYAEFKAKFLLELGYSTASPELEATIHASYDQNMEQCNQLCAEPDSKLQSIYYEMLHDVTPPDGQYARLADKTKAFSIYKPRILSLSPPYKNPFTLLSTGAGQAFYLDETNNVDATAYTTLPDGTTGFSFSTAEEFEPIFRGSWTRALITHHPEWGKYQIAKNELETSYHFDEQLERTSSFAIANNATNNYINNILNLDPFYSKPENAARKAAMKNLMEVSYREVRDPNNQIIVHHLSMWQIAWMSIHCMNANGSPMQSDCILNAPKKPPFNLNDCNGDWDKVWQIFRDLYLTEKENHLQDFYDTRLQLAPGALTDLLITLDYEPRFAKFDRLVTNDPYMTAVNSGNQGTGQGAVNNQQAVAYAQTCEGYRAIWIENLMQCDQIRNLPIAVRNNLLTQITDELKDICVRGSDPYHFLGSASEIPGDPRQYDDFEEAITAIFAQNNINITQLCHPYLITYPKKYDKQALPSNGQVILTQDECVCDRLTELRAKKLADNYQGTLVQYIQYKYGVTISQGLMDTLTNGCNGTPNCKTYPEPITIPGFLTCYGTATETCISCQEYADHVTAFRNKFPAIATAPYELPADEAQVNANLVFEQYMNYHTGFRKNWREYIQFGKVCDSTTTYPCDYLDSLVTAFKLLYGDTLTGENCRLLFVQFFNQATGNFYTWQDIEALYMQVCGHLPDVCNIGMTCSKFNLVIEQFMQWYAQQNPQPVCSTAFTNFFNQLHGTAYTWQELKDLYKALCGKDLDICGANNCYAILEVIRLYRETQPWLQPDCDSLFYVFFNNHFQTSYTPQQIDELVLKCIDKINICGPPYTCEFLQMHLEKYKEGGCQCVSQYPKETIQYCMDCFTQYMNGIMNTNYSYQQLMNIFIKECGINPEVCGKYLDCEVLTQFVDDFKSQQISGPDCKDQFLTQFNQHFGTSYQLFDDIINLYVMQCGCFPPLICDSIPISSEFQLLNAEKKFLNLYPDPAGYFGTDCLKNYTDFVNMQYGISITEGDLEEYYRNLLKYEVGICNTRDTAKLQDLLNGYLSKFGGYQFPQKLKQDIFKDMYLQAFKPLQKHQWEDIVRIYQSVGIPLMFAPADNGTLLTCSKVVGIKNAYYQFHPANLPENCEEDFAAFFNYFYQINLTYKQITDWALGNCSIDAFACGIVDEEIIKLVSSGTGSTVILPPRLCGLNEPQYPSVTSPPDDPCAYLAQLAHNSAVEQYNLYIELQLARFDRIYQAKCLGARNLEQFTVRYTPTEYHYTLYYYDQAGNLVKTVPPEGAKPDFTDAFYNNVQAANVAGTRLGPNHTMETRYFYNTLGQVTAQRTPDADISKFYYDRLGRLVISQNAKQATTAVSAFSYTDYDDLGRIKEVCEIPGSGVTQGTTQDPMAFSTWMQGKELLKRQITRTVYDEAYPPFCDPADPNNNLLCQQNLRNRVSYSYVKDNNTVGSPEWNAATFYSYDIHGNVNVLLQDYRVGIMNDANNRWKKIEYKYDLISGKVNEVAYQPGKIDAFYHRYEYDPENRLTSVSTSFDRIYWEQEAAYKYYKHGPLARMELGENQVQGLDYAYTLQGWLKGVNSSTVSEGNYDMGEDGKINSPNKLFARDAYGFALHYYSNAIEKDYAPINTNASYKPFADAAAAGTGFKSLFNGNIAAMSVNLPKLGQPLLYTYRYDQLNRLTQMYTYNGLNSNTNSWNVSALQHYREEISYDANGNIKTYKRNGDADRSNSTNTGMDNLTYSYTAGTNKFDKVMDAASDASDPDYPKYNDIKQGQLDGNYKYDLIGNLIQDKSEYIYDPQSPGRMMIEWNVYGKVAKVIKKKTGSPETNVEYTYDGSGNRISKTTEEKTTWYIRDAGGNIMSIYEKKSGVNTSPLTQIESHIYGSSRIGIFNRNSDVESMTGTATNVSFERGNKLFELSNHLQNCLTVISDKKNQHTNDNTIIDYYVSDVVSATDYGPFGIGLSSRKWDSENYRYGFNGKEQDKETSSTTTYDYGFRIYSPALGRFLSTDPLYKSYPELTPYQFASNRPIDGVDLDGLEYVTVHHFFDGSTKSELLYKKTDKEIKALGGTTAGFYNSASYGPEGKGVLHNYYNSSGEIYNTEWDQRQNSVTNDIAFHGLYSGPGSITYDGGEESKNYNFNFQPIDWSDAIAKRHDKDYEDVVKADIAKGGRPYEGFLEDTRTVQADRDMVQRINDYTNPFKKVEGVETPYRTSWSGEMQLSMEGQGIMINALATYKQWKIDKGVESKKWDELKGDFLKHDPIVGGVIAAIPKEN